jgi:hypothetical protein
MKKKSKPTEAEKKWAIEQAIKWPQIPMGYGAGGAIGGLGGGLSWMDADVVGRAQKLLTFIKD